MGRSFECVHFTSSSHAAKLRALLSSTMRRLPTLSGGASGRWPRPFSGFKCQSLFLFLFLEKGQWAWIHFNKSPDVTRHSGINTRKEKWIGQLPLRRCLTKIDQRSSMHLPCVISRGCLWKIDVQVLPALLQKLSRLGSPYQSSDRTSHMASNCSATTFWL